jgi:uncharacterized protein YpuA (DUF1002 family)
MGKSFEGVSVRDVDKELWREFKKISRKAGYDKVGELLNDVLLCIVVNYSDKPMELREKVQNCKIF